MGMSRSENMRRIRSRDTGPERAVGRLLWHAGLRYRKHVRVDGVRADFVNRRLRLAIFVDGCFWHGCPRHMTAPTNRSSFWIHKLTGNRSRDARQTALLRRRGWHVLRIWEHALFPGGGRELRTLLAEARRAICAHQANARATRTLAARRGTC